MQNQTLASGKWTRTEGLGEVTGLFRGGGDFDVRFPKLGFILFLWYLSLSGDFINTSTTGKNYLILFVNTHTLTHTYIHTTCVFENRNIIKIKEPLPLSPESQRCLRFPWQIFKPLMLLLKIDNSYTQYLIFSQDLQTYVSGQYQSSWGLPWWSSG